jgi:DNA polymerase eta
LAVIKEHLPHDLQKVEKAGIDEVFLDLSAPAHAVLLERFPELTSPPPDGDPSALLPMPPLSALEWQADALVDLDDEHTEFDDPDWDDVALLIASEIVRNIRAAIREKLKYTCSAGVARNKLLSKLGSGHNKPNQQTVIRNRAVRHFLSGFKFTKFRNLGGKLGEQLRQAFNTDSVQDLLAVSVEQLKSKFGDDSGVWIYDTLRGIDTSEVNSRTQIKSMLSAKSFRPSINTVEQARKWLQIFAADIFSRLVEEGVLENKRRPKTITLHHRHYAQTRSRQSPIHQGRLLDEETLLSLAKSLLDQIVAEGHFWPCTNLSLSVGGFEEGILRNMGIDGFLLKGEEAQVVKLGSKMLMKEEDAQETQPAGKRRRIDSSGIRQFLTKKEQTPCTGSDGAVMGNNGGETLGSLGSEVSPGAAGNPNGLTAPDEASFSQANHRQTSTTVHLCPRCDSRLESSETLQNHQDWHFAIDLQEQERVTSTFVSQPSTAGNGRPAPAPVKRPGRPKKKERGQSKLNFG